MSKITIAKYDLFNSTLIREVDDYFEKDPDYVRLTEPVEVEFIGLPDEVVVPAKVARFDAEILAARNQAAEKIAGLEERKSKLLAITHEE